MTPSSALRKVNLGSSSLQVTRCGSGLIRIGMPWGQPERPPVTAEEARGFLSRAVDAGINFFDTAAAYGTSEERLGAFLRKHPELRAQLAIASKCGMDCDPATGKPRAADYSPEATRALVDRSLERLGGHIDLMQLHSVPPDVLEEELSSDAGSLKALLDYQRSGDVRYIGITFSVWPESRLGLLEQALKKGPFASIQVPFNVNYPSLRGAIEIANRHGVGVIVNGPFGRGELAGRQQEALRFIAASCTFSTILLGTANPDHLDKTLRNAEGIV